MEYKTMDQINKTSQEIEKKVIIDVNNKQRGRFIPVSKAVNN